ncbi:MAG: M64 family metallopeptidase [Flavobacteriaceae bacterium]|nr:hypothetical protein [Flavobacteriaceae bacterium]
MSVITPVLMHTENVECHFRVLIIAEGFKDTEMSTFDTYADKAMDAILDIEPFDSNSSKINFYKVSSESVDSGIATRAAVDVCEDCEDIVDPGGNYNQLYEVTKDTHWDCAFNRANSSYYLGMSLTKRQKLEDDYGDFAGGNRVFAIIICNTTSWGGGAEFPGLCEHTSITNPKVSVAIINKVTPDAHFNFLVTHEFGHSFGDLDDEYFEDAEIACAIEEHENFLWVYANRLNVKDTNPGGWYAGARYVSSKWRATDNDLMRGKYVSGAYPVGFDSPNESLVQDRIDDEAVLCPSPGNQTFTISAIGRTTAASACNDSLTVTKYGRPVVGQTIYDDTFKTIPFDGDNKYYKTSYKNRSAKVSPSGEVLSLTLC